MKIDKDIAKIKGDIFIDAAVNNMIKIAIKILQVSAVTENILDGLFCIFSALFVCWGNRSTLCQSYQRRRSDPFWNTVYSPNNV